MSIGTNERYEQELLKSIEPDLSGQAIVQQTVVWTPNVALNLTRTET